MNPGASYRLHGRAGAGYRDRVSPLRLPTAPPAQGLLRRRRRSDLRPQALLVVVALVAVALAGCSRAVSVQVAPAAADPVCASVVLALPGTLAAGGRLDTTSQATAAWGDPAAPIVLRCGVDPPGPTTEKCVTATDQAGTSVDWVAVQEVAAGAAGGAGWTFTTYGRVPAVELRVPPRVTPQSATSLLVDLTAAVSKTDRVRSCL
jgi:ABC-type Fe3+-hydroxamate transport system substrate-binding protein